MDRTTLVYAASASVPVVESIIDADKQLVIPPGFLPVGGNDGINDTYGMPVLTMRCTPSRLATINERYVRLLIVDTEAAGEGDPPIYRGMHILRARIGWATVDDLTGIATAELVGERDPNIGTTYRVWLAGPGVTPAWLDARGFPKAS